MSDGIVDKLPQAELDALLDHIYEYGTTAEGVIERARKLCQAYAADTINKLRAELAEENRQSEIMLNNYANENQRISDERDAARADAERYRWLRSNVSGEELERITNRWPMSNEECDAAIDAIRTAPATQGE